MSVDILKFKNFSNNTKAINIAIPVLAVECEITPPLSNELDAYEEATLKLVNLGLSANGISNMLNITVSLIESVLLRLKIRGLVDKIPGQQWKLTQEGNLFINGNCSLKASTHGEFGYMFVGATRKNVFNYFHVGTLGTVQRFVSVGDQDKISRLSIWNDVGKTFIPPLIKRHKFEESYVKYIRIVEICKRLDNEIIDTDEAMEEYSEIEAFDEVYYDDCYYDDDYNGESYENEDELTSKDVFVRPLECKPIPYYLYTQLIADPCLPNGYRIESPFELDSIDNDFFQRDFQWMITAGEVFIDDEKLSNFTSREIRKLNKGSDISEKDVSVFVQEQIPLLSIYKDRFPVIYSDFCDIYSMMRRNTTIIEKESIVIQLYQKLIETLYKAMINETPKKRLEKVKYRAFDDMDAMGLKKFKKAIFDFVGIDEKDIFSKDSFVKNCVGRIGYTNGNSIVEKLINTIVIDYYLSPKSIDKYTHQEGFKEHIKLADKLNDIRKNAVHDTDVRITGKDYDFFTSNFYNYVNRILESLREA